MPKIGDLTFIDPHALNGLAFVAAIVVDIMTAHPVPSGGGTEDPAHRPLAVSDRLSVGGGRRNPADTS